MTPPRRPRPKVAPGLTLALVFFLAEGDDAGDLPVAETVGAGAGAGRAVAVEVGVAVGVGVADGDGREAASLSGSHDVLPADAPACAAAGTT